MRVALGWGLLAACLVAASPWTSVAAAVVPIGEWNTMKSTNAADTTLTYEFAVPADQPLTVSWQFRPTSYIPAYGQGAYITQGDIAVMHGNSWEAIALFEIAKHYDVDYVEAWHTNVRLFGYDATALDISTTKSGGFIPGELYTGTMAWHRDTSKIDITVAWSGGQYSETVNSSGAPVTGLNFYNTGSDDYGIGWSSFGNVVVTPEPATLSLLGLGLVGLIARRRKQRA
jgi:hypothetical protein